MPENGRESRARAVKSANGNNKTTVSRAIRTRMKSPLLSRLEEMAPNQVNSANTDDINAAEPSYSKPIQGKESTGIEKVSSVA